MNFLKFETDNIDQCLDFVKGLQDEFQVRNGSRSGQMSIMATGGGAFKFYEDMKRILGAEVLREDEMDCLIMGKCWHWLRLTMDVKPSTPFLGLDFFISEIPREVFTYSDDDPMHFQEPRGDIYPYLLVNIGSGVSMIKVSGRQQFERIGGTSLGGGTLWGLLSLLTGARTFDDMLRMAEVGDNGAVDMLVGDIYGADYSKIGLKSTTIASSFGKVFKMKRQGENQAEDHGGLSHENREDDNDASNPQPTFKKEDISRSLLYAVRYISTTLCSRSRSLVTFLLIKLAVTTSVKSPTSKAKSMISNTSTSEDPSSVAIVRLSKLSRMPSTFGLRVRSRPISSVMRAI